MNTREEADRYSGTECLTAKARTILTVMGTERGKQGLEPEINHLIDKAEALVLAGVPFAYRRPMEIPSSGFAAVRRGKTLGMAPSPILGPAGHEDESRSARPHVLLVDDDRKLTSLLRKVLTADYDVTVADDGCKALQQTGEFEPDLIVLDMNMPGMNGMAFLKAIAGSDGNPRFPVLVLTSRGNLAEFFGHLNVQGFVEKPCPLEELLGMIKAKCRRKPSRK